MKSLLKKEDGGKWLLTLPSQKETFKRGQEEGEEGGGERGGGGGGGGGVDWVQRVGLVHGLGG